MRYPASEKAEIIRLVEASHLPARRAPDVLHHLLCRSFLRHRFLSHLRS